MTDDRVGRRRQASVALAAAVACTAFLFGARDESPPSAPAPKAAFVGARVCGECHAKERDAWRGTQHARALQIATSSTVLGDFGGVRAAFGGVTSTFFVRDGRFYVNTDGPDGTLADFAVKYTIGVWPLQQYLVEMPGGRLQALGIAWDARRRSEGGQRWFHLYADDVPKAGDRLHWTGIDQNWNHQCADCHSTNVQKRFDETTRTYATTWSEIDVACEACHGPGSHHVAWARRAPGSSRFTATRGLEQTFPKPATNVGGLVAGRDESELAVCGRCHARREQVREDVRAGRPFGDAYRLALLDDGLYFVDGQQRGEVYDVGSFLESKMHARGVTCTDCHDPHSLSLRARGNALCTRCHDGDTFDAPRHTMHVAQSKAAQCVTCHMPTTTYMVIDPRHDHSFRVPRPDRTATLGTPNVCNGCHADKTPAWADAAVRARTGKAPAGNQRFAEAFASGGSAALLDVAGDETEPAIARASALTRLGAALSDDERARGNERALRRFLKDPDERVRMAAVDAIAFVEPARRAAWLAPALSDPVRSVRIDAARALAGAPERELPPLLRDTFANALAEYVDAQRMNSDRPEAQVNLAMLAADRGDLAASEVRLREALRLDASFAPAWVDLADVARVRGDESRVVEVLHEAIARLPNDATLHHALGLALVRQGRAQDALVELGRAAALAPDSVEDAYAWALALHDAGRIDDAVGALERAHRRAPDAVEVKEALVLYERDRGDIAAARAFAEDLVERTRGDERARRLLESLR